MSDYAVTPRRLRHQFQLRSELFVLGDGVQLEGKAYGVSHGGPPDKPPFTGSRSGELVVSEDGMQFKPLADFDYGGESTVRFLHEGDTHS